MVIGRIRPISSLAVALAFALVFATLVPIGVAHAREYQPAGAVWCDDGGELQTLAEKNSVDTVRVGNTVIYSGLGSETGTVKGASFDPDTCTLTLKNLTFKTKSLKAGYRASPIQVMGNNVNIRLEGKNKLVSDAGGPSSVYMITVMGESPAKTNVAVTNDGTVSTTGAGIIHTSGNLTLKKGVYKAGKMAQPGFSIGKTFEVANGVSLDIAEDNPSYTAISANKMVNKYKSVVKVRGTLPDGCTFKNDYGEFRGIYQMHKVGGKSYVDLLKWTDTANSARLSFIHASHTDITYWIHTVMSGAFNNRKGKHVQYISLAAKKYQSGALKGLTLRQIGANASSLLAISGSAMKLKSSLPGDLFKGIKNCDVVINYPSMTVKQAKSLKNNLVKHGMINPTVRESRGGIVV
ncbi:MAG: hypothetical protein IJ087_03660 [Eggerthellaceae bacterium]|nr:hypothetical protein [Eggerthellaceae bacterium]